MLQVRGLSKIYKTKNGVDVKALDNVSLQFPETGMVFLLGKSGSGKSTLLNVCGGLDSPTSGEILVKGRSSKDFTQSDFDSYRNTFIGFIFQEYNILSEFSVEDNIALALELQGKPKDKAAITALLEDVDLTGYAKRKPNTLSGGQKQRIAIARALVKAPEIIMADEPTGALDSNTGKQVFDTLKKLSRDKLVIVVSHDRDFAEQYGDRIIELKDGRILSDVSKTTQQQEKLSANVNTVGDVLCVKRGADLTDADFDKIKAFLKNADEDVLIAGNPKDITTFKKVSRITDDGAKEVFLDTDPDKAEKKQYSPEDSRFIRSKLPAKHAIKIGLSSLKSKPVRLTFTVLLCTVAFIMFGLLSTLSFYDSEATFRQTMSDTADAMMQVSKIYLITETSYRQGYDTWEYDGTYQTYFSDAEFAAFEQQFGTDVFGGVSVGMNLNVRSTTSSYWNPQLQTIAYLPENHSLRSQINGSYPAGKNEICLSSYTAQVLKECQTYDADGNLLELNAASDIIGKTINISGVPYKVTGIFESGAIPEKYETLKDATTGNSRLLYDFTSALADGLHQVAFVSLDRLKTVASENEPYDPTEYSQQRAVTDLISSGAYEFSEWGNATYEAYSKMSSSAVYQPIVAGKTQPADNEAIVSSSMYYRSLAEVFSEKYNLLIETEDYARQERLIVAMDNCYRLSEGGSWQINKDSGKDEFVTLTAAEKTQLTDAVTATVKREGVTLKLGLKVFDDIDQMSVGDVEEFTVIGVVESSGTDEDRVYLSDACADRLWEIQKGALEYYSEYSTAYTADPNAIYGTVFLPYDGSEAQTDLYWSMYKNTDFKENGSRVDLAGAFVDNLRTVDDTVNSLSQVFLYIGLVMAVFAVLLFSNFISVSISQKKREIGILRAVGARSADVFKIFFSESFFIALVCVVLSTVGCIVACSLINAQLATGIGASLLVFGATAFAVLVAIAVVTAVVATFLPVYNAAKKKPVDSIRAL